MNIQKYQVIEDTQFFKAGDIVYDLIRYDYGLARDDSNHTGIYHISVTKNSDGDYPSFTIPEHALIKID